MTLSLESIAANAPDQGSIDAARKLLKPALWPRLEAGGEDLIWGECQGSGATPYRVVVAETDAGAKCTCPSRKFPCKHALALMWLRADGKLAFAAAEPPAWVTDWVSRRRGTARPAASTASEGSKPAISLEARTEVEEEVDPKAEARAAAARERNRADREASIRAGLDELDLWLEDQIGRGMISFVAQSSGACRTIAQRLVDAKAPALAGRLDGLSARLFALPEAARPAAAVEELGQLHLLAEAYRRQDDLPAGLRADVRQAMGWSIGREELLQVATAERVEGTWRIVATRTEVQPDKLRRIETWLRLEGSDRFALLLDFLPVSTGAASSGYVVGDAIEATLVFYPSATPLRALVEKSSGSRSVQDALTFPDTRLTQALQGYESMLTLQPWLTIWPLSICGCRVRRAGHSLFLVDAEGGAEALPLEPAQADLAAPLLALRRMDAMVLWNGRHATLCWAETSLGRWLSS